MSWYYIGFMLVLCWYYVDFLDSIWEAHIILIEATKEKGISMERRAKMGGSIH